jgi:hypothetical protein
MHIELESFLKLCLFASSKYFFFSTVAPRYPNFPIVRRSEECRYRQIGVVFGNPKECSGVVFEFFSKGAVFLFGHAPANSVFHQVFWLVCLVESQSGVANAFCSIHSVFGALCELLGASSALVSTFQSAFHCFILPRYAISSISSESTGMPAKSCFLFEYDSLAEQRKQSSLSKWSLPCD